MVTEQLRDVIHTLEKLPAEDQVRVAAAIRLLLDEPPTTSRAVRDEVVQFAKELLDDNQAVLDYLRDK